MESDLWPRLSERREALLSALRYQKLRCRLVALIAAALLQTACSDPEHNGTVRFRLSFVVDVGGETKTASSVIEVRYWGNPNAGPSPSAVTTFFDWKGIAPVLDLGPHGWLIAALAPNGARFDRLQGLDPPKCPENIDAKTYAAIAREIKNGTAEPQNTPRILPSELDPSFVWVPANASYLEARPVCAQDFSRIIGKPMSLQAVSIELADDAPLLTLLPIKASWIDEIRADQGTSVTWGNEFRLLRQHQLESEAIEGDPAKR